MKTAIILMNLIWIGMALYISIDEDAPQATIIAIPPLATIIAIFIPSLDWPMLILKRKSLEEKKRIETLQKIHPPNEY